MQISSYSIANPMTPLWSQISTCKRSASAKDIFFNVLHRQILSPAGSKAHRCIFQSNPIETSQLQLLFALRRPIELSCALTNFLFWNYLSTMIICPLLVPMQNEFLSFWAAKISSSSSQMRNISITSPDFMHTTLQESVENM